MNIFFGIICIGFGVWMTAKPEMWCRVEDMFRIKGERTYSDLAIGSMVLRGIIILVLGIVLLFIQM